MILAVVDGSSLQLVLFGVVIVGVIVAVIAVASNRDVYSQIGRGGLFEDDESGGRAGQRPAAPTSTRAEREEEIRQMLRARNERRMRRGEAPLDVDSELARLESPGGIDAALVGEIRDLVIARNERRRRRGEAPLDVEAEVARQVAEFEG
ncbi:MAG: hypothetical protein ACR2ND_13990 [Solirubrobacteraceae bacterium]